MQGPPSSGVTVNVGVALTVTLPCPPMNTLPLPLTGALTFVLPSPSKKFRVRLPASLGSGQAFAPAGRSVAIFKESAGIYAISTVCTHLGCIVKPTDTGFDCPCHGSKFAKDGSVIKGPAPKALPWLEVKHLGGDNFIVDEGKNVPTGTTVTV